MSVLPMRLLITRMAKVDSPSKAIAPMLSIEDGLSLPSGPYHQPWVSLMMASKGYGVLRDSWTGSTKPALTKWSIGCQPPGSADTNLVFLPYFSWMYSARWPTFEVFVLPLRP